MAQKRGYVEGFDKRLSEIIFSKDMDFKDVAKMAGVAEDLIWRYRCSYSMPSVVTLYRLSKGLNVSADYLLGLSNKKEINR